MSKHAKGALQLLLLIVLPQLAHVALRSSITLLISTAAGLVWIIISITGAIRSKRQKRSSEQPPTTTPVYTVKPLEPTVYQVKPVTHSVPEQRKKPDLSIDKDADLTPNEYLNRIDAKTWYFNRNELVLAQLIDNLNVRGCKCLEISADGSVHITEDGTTQTIQHLEDFPHHMNWPELCQLLSEDDISTSITDTGIHLSWIGGEG